VHEHWRHELGRDRNFGRGLAAERRIDESRANQKHEQNKTNLEFGLRESGSPEALIWADNPATALGQFPGSGGRSAH
jgi:hypothetical protein